MLYLFKFEAVRFDIKFFNDWFQAFFNNLSENRWCESMSKKRAWFDAMQCKENLDRVIIVGCPIPILLTSSSRATLSASERVGKSSF